MKYLLYLAGKAAMADNPGIFNKEASEAYKRLNEKEKENLQQRCVDSASEPMTKRRIAQRASKIFTRIQNLVRI